jgi:hypothetical protein
MYDREKFHAMLQDKYVVTQQKIKGILKDRYFSMTTDSWTSTGNHGYVTCTAHFVFAFSCFWNLSERWGIHCSRHNYVYGKSHDAPFWASIQGHGCSGH